MTTIAQAQAFIRGLDLTAAIQKDAKGIQSSDIETVINSFTDLQGFLKSNPEFKDLFNNPYSQANIIIQKITTDAKGYLNSINLQVEQPNNPGHYINLYIGNLSYNYSENFKDGFDESGYVQTPNKNTLWEIMQTSGMDMAGDPDPYGNAGNWNLVTDMGDCYYHNGGGVGPGLATDWSQNGHFSWKMASQGSGSVAAAAGSLKDWTPFVHLTQGDASALNKDAFMA